MTLIANQLQIIGDKLSELRVLDKNYSVFGAEQHEYKFNSTISIDEILVFEKQHNISLPADYREFLLTFGNGGCGPYYGLLSLQKGVLDIPQNPQQSEIIQLSNFFRFETSWNLNEIDDYDDVKWCDGMLRLCHEGCGYFLNLIITGNERGNIWNDARVSDSGIFPLVYANGGERTSFIQWYLNWLNYSINEVKNSN